MPKFLAPGRGSGPLEASSTAPGPGLAVGQDRPSLLCSRDSGGDRQDVPKVTDRGTTIMAPLLDNAPCLPLNPRMRSQPLGVENPLCLYEPLTSKMHREREDVGQCERSWWNRRGNNPRFFPVLIW
jgi:hypothetical protein